MEYFLPHKKYFENCKTTCLSPLSSQHLSKVVTWILFIFKTPQDCWKGISLSHNILIIYWSILLKAIFKLSLFIQFVFVCFLKTEDCLTKIVIKEHLQFSIWQFEQMCISNWLQIFPQILAHSSLPIGKMVKGTRVRGSRSNTGKHINILGKSLWQVFVLGSVPKSFHCCVFMNFTYTLIKTSFAGWCFAITTQR